MQRPFFIQGVFSFPDNFIFSSKKDIISVDYIFLSLYKSFFERKVGMIKNERCNLWERYFLQCRSRKRATFFWGVDMVVTFCGHSYFKEEYFPKEEFLRILEEKVGDKPVEFLLGNKGSFDYYAHKCCLEYKKTHPKACPS